MSSYIDGVLAPNERVLHSGTLTNWIYFLPWVFVIVTMGIFFPILILPLIDQKTTELVVTDRRVIAKLGLVSRRTIEMRVSKIESIRVDQGVFGRMFDFGTIVIHGVGGASEPIKSVAAPLLFKRAVEAQVDIYEQRSQQQAPMAREPALA